MSAMRDLTAYHPIAGLVPADSVIGEPIPLPTSFAFLDLPSEIRIKIYRFLYRSHLPIYPTVAERNSTGSCRDILKRTSFPTDFLHVSRQIYSEASAVLWSDNIIVLQFPLNWNHERDRSSLSHEQGRIQPHWFAQHETRMPPLHHLQQIQNLVIEVHLFRCTASTTPAHIPAEPASVIRREIEKLCTALEHGHHLRRLEIRFTNVLSSYNPNELLISWSNCPVKHYSDAGGQSVLPWTNIPAAGCCSQFGNSAFGRKDLSIEDLERLCRQSIEVDQQVLEPLTRLRGVDNVSVVGRLSEDWAHYLRRCMRTFETPVEGFKHSNVVKWT